MNELKILEVSNISYKKVKNEMTKYKKLYIHLLCLCSVLIIAVLYLAMTSVSLYGNNQRNIKTIAELSNKVSVLEKNRDDSLILLAEKDEMINSLNTINEYVNSKIIAMQANINDLNDYIKVNVIKLEATPHLDLSTNTEMDTETMNQIIDHFAETNNTRFQGHGQAFIEASKRTGLNPVFILSLSCLESNYGTSNIAMDKNNFMGIGAYDDSPYESSYTLGDDIDAGIINGAEWVKRNYYDQGQKTLHDMIYGPKMYSSARNHWINSICSLMNTSYKVAIPQ